MLIEDLKVVFFHIPKTAGDSVEDAFLAIKITSNLALFEILLIGFIQRIGI